MDSAQGGLLDELAAECTGYCGADLKALCAEAALTAVQRRYPQIYQSDKKLRIDESTVVDANARKGFMQGGSLPYPEEPSVYWPQGINADGQIVNLRHLTDSHDPGVASYVIDEEYGWCTATNASKGLLIGYLWKTEDYPWFDAWRNVKDGKPFARGLEFGTSGLHQPFPVLTKKGFIFGRPIFVHIDAGETQARSYANFLMEVPAGFKGVGRLQYADGKLTLFERGGTGQLEMKVGELF